MKTNKQRIQQITGIGLFSAAVVVLQFVSMSLRFTTFSITLTLIPIVVGAAIYGVTAGGWLGFVFGLAVLLTGDAAAFLTVNFPGTIITVLAKGIWRASCRDWSSRHWKRRIAVRHPSHPR